MRVALLGATGRTGRHALEELLARGHELSVLTRAADKLEDTRHHVRAVEGDATDAGAVDRALAGTEAVLSVLGPDRARQGDLHTRAIDNVIEAMRRHGATRLVVLSGAGVDAPGDRKGAAARLSSALTRLATGPMLADRQRELERIQASGLRWTVARPPRLVDGDAATPVDAGTDLQLGLSAKVPRAALARFLVDQLEDGHFVDRAPFVAAL